MCIKLVFSTDVTREDLQEEACEHHHLRQQLLPTAS